MFPVRPPTVLLSYPFHGVTPVRRIDTIFDVERTLNGLPVEQRRLGRQERVASLVAELEHWMRGVRGRISRHADVGRAMDYMLKRWPAFTRFLDDGWICLSNNAAERALHKVARRWKSWLFCGSDRGGARAAVMYTLLGTTRLNKVDPQARLADVLAQIADHPAHRIDELLPWNWNCDDVPAASSAAA